MNDKTTDSLDGIFSIIPTSELTTLPSAANTTLETIDAITGEIVEVDAALSPEEVAAKEDFTFTRDSLKTIAGSAQTTMLRSMDVANQLDKASSFEAVADMVRATVEVHRELQALHKSAAEVRAASQMAAQPQGGVNIDKGIVFAGTSEELLRLISTDRK